MFCKEFIITVIFLSLTHPNVVEAACPPYPYPLRCIGEINIRALDPISDISNTVLNGVKYESSRGIFKKRRIRLRRFSQTYRFLVTTTGNCCWKIFGRYVIV